MNAKTKTMTHAYNITGMTCTGCQQKVRGLLLGVGGVKTVEVDLEKGEAVIEMDSHIATEDLQSAFGGHPKFRLSEAPHALGAAANSLVVQATMGHTAAADPAGQTAAEEPRASFLTVYRPIILIFGYLLGVSFIPAISARSFDLMVGMRVFMGGFFLVFSFFKFLDLEGFVDSYAMYDLVARQFRQWGYVYAFLELILGLAYALNFQLFITNLATLVVMTVGLAGVLKSVLAKRKIRCACLGAVFNLPMSTVTIIEDALMIVMSVVMLGVGA